MYNLISASAKDIKKLIQYKLTTIFEYAKNIEQNEKNRIIKYVNNNIPKQIDNYQMIVINNKKIGCVCVIQYENGILLDEIYLEESFRNLGIGSHIIKDILKDYMIVYLWAYKENKRAIKLYKKLGFIIFEATETRYLMKNN